MGVYERGKGRMAKVKHYRLYRCIVWLIMYVCPATPVRPQIMLRTSVTTSINQGLVVPGETAGIAPVYTGCMVMWWECVGTRAEGFCCIIILYPWLALALPSFLTESLQSQERLKEHKRTTYGYSYKREHRFCMVNDIVIFFVILNNNKKTNWVIFTCCESTVNWNTSITI